MNYVAVLVVAVVAYIFGWLWYSDLLFGKSWRKLSGVKSMNPSGLTLALGFVSGLVISLFLEYLNFFIGNEDFFVGLVLGAGACLGFVATVSLGSVIYEKKPVKLYLMNMVHYLIVFAVGSGVLAVW